jgi:hypothetical protein
MTENKLGGFQIDLITTKIIITRIVITRKKSLDLDEKND